MTLEHVLDHYFPGRKLVNSIPNTGGSVNKTYHIILESIDSTGTTSNQEGEHFILQQMNDIFDIEVMQDTKAITEHLVRKNITTSEVVKTGDGKLSVEDSDTWWRLMTYIPGRQIDSAQICLEQAESAGRLLGQFHTALLDCEYTFKFALPHYRDTVYTIEKLRKTLEEYKESQKYSVLAPLAENILKEYEQLPKGSDLPMRVIHGDAKIENVRFDTAGEHAIALIDLDTLMHGTLDLEVGDALRSWSKMKDQTTGAVTFNQQVYIKSLEGYFETTNFLTDAEREAIPNGILRITLDLSARYLTDAFREEYFTLIPSEFESLYEQTKTFAHDRFALFKQIQNFIKK